MTEEPLKSTPASRAFMIFAAIIITTAVVVVFGIKLISDARTEATDASEQAESNSQVLGEMREIQRIILAVTGCTKEMTDKECQDRLKQTSIEEGDRRIREVDCRTYRALRGEPPLGPGERCLDSDAASQSGGEE